MFTGAVGTGFRTEHTTARAWGADDPAIANALAAGFLTRQASADFPPVIDLGDLDPATGFSIRGDGSGDYTGWSVSDAGDINGDGFDDIIIGASPDYSSDNASGVSYVIYGKADGFGDIDLGHLAAGEGFVIKGSEYRSYAGASVSSAGDINGDGFGDIIIGAPGRYGIGNDAGEAYVIFGRAEGYDKIKLGALTPDQGFAIERAPGAKYTGESVSSAGDINGDGFDDIIVGASYAYGKKGAAYVIFGKADGFADVDLGKLAPDDGFIIVGGSKSDYAGISVSSAGDVNGDGLIDIIVGAEGVDGGGKNAGAAYVLFGKTDGFGTVDLDMLSASDGFVIQGDLAGDLAGSSVSSAGDFNGDGFDDVIVGAPFSDDNGNLTGEAFIVFGHAGGFDPVDLTDISADDGFAIKGAYFQGNLGGSVSSAGDVNGDGFDDVIVGADGAGPNDGYQGTAYVLFGKAAGFGTVDLTHLDPDDGFMIVGDRNFDSAGYSVSGAGDIDGDGFADMIVGAPFASGGGEAYVIYGQAPTEAVTRIGSAAGQTIRGGEFDDTLRGKQGEDTLVGAGGDDRLRGGGGADDLQGGAGADRMSGGGGADVFRFQNRGETGGDRITDFSHAQHDRIDLSALDADRGKGGNQSFTFIGESAFTGAAGELRSIDNGDGSFTVQGDNDRDGVADFQLLVTASAPLVAADFVL